MFTVNTYFTSSTYTNLPIFSAFCSGTAGADSTTGAGPVGAAPGVGATNCGCSILGFFQTEKTKDLGILLVKHAIYIAFLLFWGRKKVIRSIYYK